MIFTNFVSTEFAQKIFRRFCKFYDLSDFFQIRIILAVRFKSARFFTLAITSKLYSYIFYVYLIFKHIKIIIY